MAADPGPSAHRYLLVVVLLSVIGFGTNLFVATEFDDRHAYADWETLFGSDPNWYLLKLTDGTYSSRRHPLVHVFVSFPARAAAPVISRVSGEDEDAVRRQLVLLASPLASGAKTALLLALCGALGLGLRLGLLIALIDIASLSRLIFGSIPESFGGTGLAMTWMLYLTARALRDGRGASVSHASWFGCGLFAFGITVTNVVPFAILLAAVLVARLGRWRPALLQSGSLAGLVILAGAALHVASQAWVLPDAPRGAQSASRGAAAVPQPDRPDVLRNIRPFVRSAPLVALRQLPGTLAATFFAPPALAYPSEAPGGPGHARSRLQVGVRQFTPEWLGCIGAIVVILGAAAYAARLVGAPVQPLALAIAAVLAFNLALFTAWGGSVFIYTLHWQPFLIGMLALAATAPGGFVRTLVGAYVLLLAMELVWNVRFLAAAWGAL